MFSLLGPDPCCYTVFRTCVVTTLRWTVFAHFVSGAVKLLVTLNMDSHQGCETTTERLGQGCGNAAGMALEEAMLAACFNREGFPVVDHRTFVITGDGDMMEGGSREAFSLAGHLGLHKLIVFYNYNRITIDGTTDFSCSDDVRRRFEGYRWNVLEIDGHDVIQIERALDSAITQRQQPTLIIGHMHIGKGSPHKQDTSACHGAPLGEEGARLTKQALRLPADRAFWVPEEVRTVFAER